MKLMLRLLLTFIVCVNIFLSLSANTTQPFQNPFTLQNQYDNFKNIFFPKNANLINALFQDKYGMIWIGTNFGLFSYDGYRVQAAGSVSKSIFSIIQLDDHRLCLATDEGVLYFNLFSEQFEAPLDFLNSIGAVRSLIQFHDALWIGTRDKGLFRYNLKDKKLDSIPPIGVKGEQTIIYTLAETTNRLYIGSYEGLSCYDVQTKQRTIINLPIKNRMVNSLFWEEKTNVLWVGTEGYLFCYNLKNNIIEQQKELPVTSFKSISTDISSNIVLGTDNGLYIYNPRDKTYKRNIHDSRNAQSLCNDVVWSLFRDKDNNIWLGTDHGLSLAVAKSAYKFVHISELTNTGEGNRFSVIKIDSRGNYWMGGVNGLILLKKEAVGYSERWFRMENKQYPLLHNRIRAVYEDRDQDIWIATDGGVARYDNEKEQFDYCHITHKQGKLNTNWAYSLYEDKAGKLWIASYMGGLFVVDKKTIIAGIRSGKFIESNVNYADKTFTQNPLGNIAYNVLSDKTGVMWVNTQQDGLVSIYPETKKVLKRNIYPNEIIYDGNQYLWYISLNAIYRMDISTGEVQLVKQYDDAYEISALSLQKDKLWYVCTDGVYCLDIQTLYSRKIPVPNYFLQSVYYDVQNKLFLWGGEDGIMCLFPDLSINDVSYNSIHVTSVWANGKRLLPADIDYRGKSVRFCSQIELPYSYTNLSVEFSTFNYATEIVDGFYYRLDQSDSTWLLLEAGQNRISIGQLPPGVHRVFVRQGENIGKVTSFDIIILPPWYASAWAYVGYVAILIIILLGVVIHFKIKYRRRIERIEKEKSLELSILKIDFFTNIAHELKTPLTLIIAPLGNLISEIRNSEHRRNLLLIQKNATRLNSLIQKVLDFKKIEFEGDDTPVRSQVEVCSFIRSLTQNFLPTLAQRNIQLSFLNDTPALWLNLDVMKIESALTNIISNATKFTTNNNGKIDVKLTSNDEFLRIDVTDNGQGIPKNDLPYVFVRFFQSSYISKQVNGTGIGLYLAQKYVRLHSGTIDIKSEGLNKGTTVTVILPLSGDNLILSTENEIIALQDPEESENELPTLLIIDDNVEIVSFLEKTLSNHYHCFTAYSGYEGFSVAQKQLPDLIIIDQIMPDMDGVKVCKLLRKYHPTASTPIVMLTAQSDMDTQIDSLKAGVDIFMPKPFDINVLILQLIQLRQSRKLIEQQLRIEAIRQQSEQENTTLSPDEVFLSRIVNIIENNLENSDFNVTMLNSLAGTEAKQLYRKMKQLTGLAPIDFIRKVRIKKAAMMLGRKGLTVNEVMYLVGYTSASYFTKCFFAEFGVTPKQYVAREETEEIIFPGV